MAEKVTIGNCELVWIYALCDPVTNEPRYVGKTSKPLLQRLKEHKQLARRKRRLPVQRWMNAVDGVNLCGAYMRVLETANSETWADRERHWIDYGRRNGWDLFNLTAGGDGLHGLIKSPDHVAKIAESLKKGAMFTCQCGKEFWRKPSAIAKGEAKFCSRTCYQEWQRGKPKAIPKGQESWASDRSCEQRCACAPTGWWSARCVGQNLSTCWRH